MENSNKVYFKKIKLPNKLLLKIVIPEHQISSLPWGPLVYRRNPCSWNNFLGVFCHKGKLLF
jgi:hypothetical protein